MKLINLFYQKNQDKNEFSEWGSFIHFLDDLYIL